MNRRLLIIYLFLLRSGVKRGKYLKKHNIFYHMGDNCYYHPANIPTEPYLVSFGDNVSVASGVKFITHDVMGYMLDRTEYMLKNEQKLGLLMGKIEIGNNVAIGQNSIILYNTKIGSNTIIGAGSIVTSDIPENSVAVGVPCRVVGSIDEYVKKRCEYKGPRDKKDVEQIIKYFWEEGK